MRRLLLASVAAGAFSITPALAADLPVKAPPPVAAPAASWTGCYIGGNVGGGWSGVKSMDPASSVVEIDHTISGFVGGGQIGCDYQFATKWVIGIQAMWDWSDVSGDAHTSRFPPDIISARVRSFDTLTARIGYAVTQTALLYAKFGAGWVDDNFTYRCGGSGGFCIAGLNMPFNQTRDAFDAGLGFAWMFSPNWDVFVEYDHMDLQTKLVSFRGLGGAVGVDQNIRQDFNKVLVGLDYRLNPWGATY